MLRYWNIVFFLREEYSFSLVLILMFLTLKDVPIQPQPELNAVKEISEL